MKLAPLALRLLAFCLLLLPELEAQSSMAGRLRLKAPQAQNRPPRIRSSLSQGTVVRSADDLAFTVTARDPDGDGVTLRLLNPLPGMTLEPAPVSSRVVRHGTWFVPVRLEGPQHLIFEAFDDVQPGKKVRLQVDLTVATGDRNPLTLGDVNGDGRLDVVAAANRADVNGVVDAGALYVWLDATKPTPAPEARLIANTLTASDLVSLAAVKLIDLNGDGVLDIVSGSSSFDANGVSNSGVVLVWYGGNLAGDVLPSATLLVPDASPSDLMTSSIQTQAAGIQFADLTGNGYLDVLAKAPRANANGVPDSGALYLWEGGPTLQGDVSPTARFHSVVQSDSDFFSRNLRGESLRFADVTGDGLEDLIVASAEDFTSPTTPGVIHVWAGGSGLSGTPSPIASLAATTSGGLLASGLSGGYGYEVTDVSGDGIADIIALNPRQDSGGVTTSGAVLVWFGGSALAGQPAPSAELTLPSPSPDDRLGTLDFGSLVDVTGDGIVDVVAGAPRADPGGVTDAGVLAVWAGGASLTGTPAPTAMLSVPGAQAGDKLGFPASRSSANTFTRAVRKGDLDGDGFVDLVVITTQADVAGVQDAGALYVWRGGPTLLGAQAPHATLSVPGSSAQPLFGITTGGVRLRDVVGDANLDVIALANLGTIAGVQSGAAYVWEGGSSLQGARAPTATLHAPVGLTGWSSTYFGVGIFNDGPAIRFADVDGDGRRDVLISDSSADVNGLTGVGAIYFWSGGPTLNGALTPQATFSGLTMNDHLTQTAGFPFHLQDLNDDGILDVLAGAPFATSRGVPRAGALYSWEGRAGFSGLPAPTLWNAPLPRVDDKLSETAGQGLLLADITGDGPLEMIAAGPEADVGSLTNAGRIYWGHYPMDSLNQLWNPAASAGDELGK